MRLSVTNQGFRPPRRGWFVNTTVSDETELVSIKEKKTNFNKFILLDAVLSLYSDVKFHICLFIYCTHITVLLQRERFQPVKATVG